jgi:hypothetical protein
MRRWLIVMGCALVALFLLGVIVDSPARARRAADGAYLTTLLPGIDRTDAVLHAYQQDGPSVAVRTDLHAAAAQLRARTAPPADMVTLDARAVTLSRSLDQLADDAGSAAASTDLVDVNQELAAIDQEAQRQSGS